MSATITGSFTTKVRLSALLGASYGTLELAITCAEVSPSFIINGVQHFGDEEVERIGEALREMRQSRHALSNHTSHPTRKAS